MTSPKSFHVKSFGCQMNVYDGDRMGELLESEGMVPAATAAHADVVVLNTCHIRERAVHRVYSEIGSLRREDGTRPIIAVAGCVAQAEGAEVARRRRDSRQRRVARRRLALWAGSVSGFARRASSLS